MSRHFKFATPVALFVLAFCLLPLAQFQGLGLIPGDVGDARLNNYFLENVYRFLRGESDSLWHLSFFYPFPYVLGFSDNLFGSSPVYVLFRLLGIKSDTSYQLWFLFGYAANFAAAFFALRKLGSSILAASIGAVIFAFALPTSAHAGHAQLHYRFGIPLAAVYFFDFLDKKTWRSLSISAGWLAWQFYAGVYMGFFASLLLAAMLLTFLAYEKYGVHRSLKQSGLDFWSAWLALPKAKKNLQLLFLTAAILAMVLLFYPYMQVSHLYGVKRSWAEISTMLPRPQSYLLSDSSFLWASNDSKIFQAVPMRYEHQMLAGLAPAALAVIGFLVGSRDKNGAAFTLMTGMLGVTIVSTLYIGGYSLWYLLHKLPLASAIRAMTRLDQVFLFPLAYLACIAIDQLRARRAWGTKAVVALIVPFILFELSMTTIGSSNKQAWRDRIAAAEQLIPAKLPKDSVIFMAPRSGPFYADELDAMWVALNRGNKTLNGYSGLFPPGYGLEHGTDCAAVPSRVLAYLDFVDLQNDDRKYKELASKIVPLGFQNCDPNWLNVRPTISSTDRAYTGEEIRNLSYSGLTLVDGNGTAPGAVLKIANANQSVIPARSTIGTPLRLSWRFLGAEGNALSQWDTRKELPFDIPPRGELSVQIPFGIPPESATQLQVSIVQEHIFWAHDIGVAPASISLK